MQIQVLLCFNLFRISSQLVFFFKVIDLKMLIPTQRGVPCCHMSNEIYCFLGYIGDYTTQLCGDCFKPWHKDPY